VAELCEQFKLSDPFRALHPFQKDFTYIPRTGKKNRSRIDFFLISDTLLSLVHSCEISPSLETSLFDHKYIKLSFQNRPKCLKNFIDPKIFKHERFEAVLVTAVAESYLQHADPDGNIDVDTGLIEVGNLISKIRKANDLEFDIFFEGPTVQKEYKLASINAEIKLLLEDFPNPAEFNEFQLTCPNDTFFEVLVGNIRNSLVSFQTWLRKVEASKVSAITKRLNFLKGHYDENQSEIFDLEQILGSFRDDDLASKIQNLKIFEHLHNERPSPLF
jgi:hypothetical protein